MSDISVVLVFGRFQLFDRASAAMHQVVQWVKEVCDENISCRICMGKLPNKYILMAKNGYPNIIFDS